jgi:hypothetical protein
VRADARLEHAVQALSGRERALLFLREYKDGVTREITTPQFLSQREHNEYARLVNMIAACNNVLGDLVLILKEQVAQEELRFNAMRLLIIAADDMWLMGEYISRFVPEPVTASEAKGREEPKAGFVVYDDENADDVATQQEDRQMVLKWTGRGYRLKLPLDLTDVPLEPKTEIDKLRLIAVIVRDNLASAWSQLRAVDVVVGEVADDLGDDPLRPAIRECLDDALGRCGELRDELVSHVGAWELPSDIEETLALTRTVLERAVR